MTDVMDASVYVGDGVLEVQQVAVPEPGPDDVLVEIAQCGICGTDVHLVLERIARPGTVLGHEWAGTIAALGDAVDGWAVGQRVVCGPSPGCGRCRACRAGRPSVCLERPLTDHLDFRGAYARYVVAPAAQLLAVPEELSTREAALVEPTAVAMHAVTLSGVTADDRVLVTGAGPVGLLVTAVLHAQGVHDVTVSEPSPVRRERALAVGAARVVEPHELPRARMGAPVDAPFSVAFECSGRADAAESAIDQLDSAGTCVLVGTGHELPRINHNRVIVLENSIIGAYNYDAAGFAPALQLLASGAMPLDALVEPVDISLDDLLPVMRRCAAGELPGKVMVRPIRSEE
ncbi:MAG TPA: alcohol dehydrogenase catalytic domain-containing protein [Acidimicrobiia bacterium]|nr:alcohol dehydrogenase catalytic domain-containing protein [Acidimicrobiia bacterium]